MSGWASLGAISLPAGNNLVMASPALFDLLGVTTDRGGVIGHLPKAILASALVSLAICFIKVIRSLTGPVAPEWAAMVEVEMANKTTARQIFAADKVMTNP